MQATPYLFFEGRCEEALAFYAAALGGEVTGLMRYRDAPDGPPTPPERADMVMHAELRAGSLRLWASDGQCRGSTRFDGFGLALEVADTAEAARAFDALGAGGQVLMPLSPTFFSPAFGMVADRFGVTWMVTTPAG